MRRGLLVILGVLALVVGTSSSASAAVVQVRGVQTPVDDVHAAMTGDLVGTWTLTDFGDLVEHPAGNVKASGAERFDGCLDVGGDGSCGPGDPAGWLTFSFEYSTAVSGNGRCHHPVTDAGGDFAGATGQLTMKDRVGSCGELRTTYSGHLDLVAG
jgi:hypothetical protein